MRLVPLQLATAALLIPTLGSCTSGRASLADLAKAGPPVATLQRADHLIQPGEDHFAGLWQVTKGGENAEAYWSYGDDRLVLQRRAPEEGVDCDRIYVTATAGSLDQVSNGRGVTTCAFFLPGDREVLFASTHAEMDSCPAPPDRSQGYVWQIHDSHDIYVVDLETGAERRLTEEPGYDAEAVVSPTGDRIVFTSLRDGDPELYTCDLAGEDVRRVTNIPGYDGGAFFSHSGERLVYRRTKFNEDNLEAEIAEFNRLLELGLVRPSDMEVWTVATDGSDAQQVTALGGANWAPYFTPDDSHILFSSNHADSPREFDIFMAPGTDGPHGADAVERITTYDGFDSFPMFSRNGRWLAFSSNRGGTSEGETNVFVALWR